MARWLGVFAVAFVVAIAGCGSVTGSRVSPSPSPKSGANLALSDTDAGRTVPLHTGQVVSVTLHQAQGYTVWADLHSTNPAVLAPRVDTRRLAVRGVTLGTFAATGPGTAQLQATSSASCPPLQVCPAMARGWSVTIQVS